MLLFCVNLRIAEFKRLKYMEYLIVVLGILIFIVDDFFNFLSKSMVWGISAVLFMAILHITIRAAVIEAINETK